MADLIYRQAAIDIIEKGRLTKLIDAEVARIGIEQLPPAQPERTGHWIDIDAETYTWKVRCDKCGNERSMMSTQGRYPKFCEECGRRMIEKGGENA